MSTIPDPFHDRLATASITHEDGAALIALLEELGHCAYGPVADAYAELVAAVAR